MAWKQCAACAKWYDDAVYRSCAIVNCANFTGLQNRDAVQVVHGIMPAAPARRAVLRPAMAPPPAPLQLARRMAPAPLVQHAVLVGFGGNGGGAAAAPANANAGPDCDICGDAKPGVRTHCGSFICNTCLQRDTATLLTITKDKIICAFCRKPIDPAIYNGVVPLAVLDRVMRTVAYLKGGAQPSGAIEMSWNLSPPCPKCGAELGLDAGCDIVTCPKCGSQVNLAIASIAKAGLAHTTDVGDFLKLIQGFDPRSGNFVLKQCTQRFAGVWKALKFDVLIEMLDKARGSEAQVRAILDKLVSSEVQSLKAFLLSEYIRPQAQTAAAGTAAAK